MGAQYSTVAKDYLTLVIPALGRWRQGESEVQSASATEIAEGQPELQETLFQKSGVK